MPYALCPMPYALCPMPYALCPMPYALCRIVPHMRARKAIYYSNTTGIDIILIPMPPDSI